MLVCIPRTVGSGELHPFVWVDTRRSSAEGFYLQRISDKCTVYIKGEAAVGFFKEFEKLVNQFGIRFGDDIVNRSGANPGDSRHGVVCCVGYGGEGGGNGEHCSGEASGQQEACCGGHPVCYGVTDR